LKNVGYCGLIGRLPFVPGPMAVTPTLAAAAIAATAALVKKPANRGRRGGSLTNVATVSPG